MVAVVGCAVVVASLLPAFELAIEGVSGPLGEEVDYRYEEHVTLAWNAGPIGLAPLLVGALVAVGGVGGYRRRARAWLAAGTLAASIGLAVLQGLSGSGVVRWTVDDDPRVYTSQGGAGPLVESAVDRLRADAAESAEAADPTWRLAGDEHDFGITRRFGWTLLGSSTLLLYSLGVYRVARLRLPPWLAVLAAVAVTVLTLVWLLARLLDAVEP